MESRVTYKTSGKEAFAHDLYNMCRMDGGYFILMGDPTTPKKIVYGRFLNEIDINTLPLPQNMIAFTTHGGSIIVDESADIMKVVSGTIDSFKYPRACKVPTGIFVHGSILNEFINELRNAVEAQTIGNVLSKDTDIANLSDTQWNIVDDFIRVAKTNGEVVYGGRINQPTIIKGHFYSSLLMEPQFPVYCIEAVDDENQAIEKINEVSSKTPQRRILDLSVYSENNALFQKIQKLRKEGYLKVYSLHFNRPTLSYNPYTAHEGILLREYLSEPEFLDRNEDSLI
ncbi:NAD/NADP-dependent betaine aldehyde dehydrogenase [uncultured archaeon]|nr:NAD/NADP-dependent betaine aldehyde dehydrogenase [uncultured archaeon]